MIVLSKINKRKYRMYFELGDIQQLEYKLKCLSYFGFSNSSVKHYIQKILPHKTKPRFHTNTHQTYSHNPISYSLSPIITKRYIIHLLFSTFF